LLLQGDIAAKFLGKIAGGVAKCGAFFYRGKNVKRGCGEEEDVALIITLELLADIFGYGGIGGVAEVKDFVRTLATADAWDCGGAVDGWGLGVTALRSRVVVEMGGVLGRADGAVGHLGVICGTLMTVLGL
jgi:hypothetical protein